MNKSWAPSKLMVPLLLRNASEVKVVYLGAPAEHVSFSRPSCLPWILPCCGDEILSQPCQFRRG
jgi:hypothetical protein